MTTTMATATTVTVTMATTTTLWEHHTIEIQKLVDDVENEGMLVDLHARIEVH